MLYNTILCNSFDSGTAPGHIVSTNKTNSAKLYKADPCLYYYVCDNFM